MSSIVHADFSRDRQGDPVEPELEDLLETLANCHDCHKVICFDGDTGHCGYWAKRSSIGQAVLDQLRTFGYEPVHFKERDGHGYVEFRPTERDEL